MKIANVVILCCFTTLPDAQGGIISPRSSKTTMSPNDVLAPPVQPVYMPPKSSSSKTDVLVGALGVTSAVLPYLGQLTQMFSSDEPVATHPAGELVLKTDQVSRFKRNVVEDLESEIASDSFLGMLISPFTVIWETATIIYDVLMVTNEQGLTDFKESSNPVRSKRSIFDIFNANDLKDYSLKYGSDLAQVKYTLPDHVSISKTEM